MSLARAVRPKPSRPAEAEWVEEAARSLVDLSDNPVRIAFLRRALGEVIALARQDEATLLEALATPGQVVPLLREREEPASARWARARDDGRRKLVALLETEGGVLTPEQVAERLKRTRQAVHQRQKKGQLLAVPGVRGAVYPAWQFDGDGMLAGFEDTLAALGDTPPAMAVQFFLTGRESLDGASPLDCLRAGRVDDTIRAAFAFAAG